MNRAVIDVNVLVSEAETKHDLWASYDPERVRRALKESAGALAHLDREAFLREIYEQREQDSQGRPG